MFTSYFLQFYHPMPNDPITVKLDYTEQEYVKAVRLYYNRYYHAQTYLVAAIFTILVGLGVWQLTQAKPIFSGVVFFTILVTIPMGYYFILPPTMYRRSPRLKELYWLTFYESHIEMKSEHTSAKVEWQFYQTMWESEQFFFLFAKTGPTIIPKRTFENETQLYRFREIVNRKYIESAQTR